MPDDLQRLQGVWTLVRSVREGEEVPSELLRGSTFEFSGDRMIPSRDESDYSTVALHPTTSPPRIDLTDRDGNLMKGVYRLDGDSFEMCVGRVGSARPDGFESTPACDCYSLTMSR